MREYISSLVQQTLNEYLNKAHGKKRILILLSNDRVDSKEILNHIEELSNQFSISILISENEQVYVNNTNVSEVVFYEKITEKDIPGLFQGVDLLYCPSISHGFLAQLSMLLDDSRPVWIALQMLLEGKVVLLGNEIINRRRSVNFWQRPLIDRKVQSYIKDLKNNGVYFCSFKQASKIINKQIKKVHQNRPLLLAKHIEEIANMGHNEIVIPNNSLITPMAKDAAKQLHVNLKKEKEDEKRDAL